MEKSDVRATEASVDLEDFPAKSPEVDISVLEDNNDP